VSIHLTTIIFWEPFLHLSKFLSFVMQTTGPLHLLFALSAHFLDFESDNFMTLIILCLQ
jgi:hypothetical protein